MSSEPLADAKLERFCLAYVTLELTQPGAPGNAAASYREVKPTVSLKTAQNQAKTWLDRPEVRDRVAVLIAEGEGADHVVHSGAFIDNLLLRTIQAAEAQKDAPTMLRAAELADRGRVGGARFIKETKSRRIAENPLSGKSPQQVEAMRRAALAELGIDPDAWEDFEAFRKARTLEATTRGEGPGQEPERAADVGPEDRGVREVH